MSTNEHREKELRGKAVYAAISEILWREWDPIGVNQNENLRDEYDSYVGPVYRYLATSSPDDVLIDFFQKTETEHMGLSYPAPKEKLRLLIKELQNLDLSI